ncbi:hypothetical protein QE152_g23257 [Popillia japonica]|uniref:Uncharacterized protein n=1 Tax=Popillia japonica TaxID=7064 RepID=A0AAW1KIY4_POPJA
MKVQELQKDTCFMEEIRKMLKEFKAEFKEEIAEIKTEIRTEMKGMLKDVKELKLEVRQVNEEIKNIKEEITNTREKWEKENEILNKKIKNSEERLEKMNRRQIRNKLVITGLKNDKTNKTILKEDVENLIDTHLGIKVKIKNVYKIGENRCVAEMEDWDEKCRVLKEKNKLKGKNVYIDSDLTPEERRIQKRIR